MLEIPGLYTELNTLPGLSWSWETKYWQPDKTVKLLHIDNLSKQTKAINV